MGIVGAGSVLAACGVGLPATTPAPRAAPGETDELGDPVNTFDEITNYNNYYEFSTAKDAVAPLSQTLATHPWTVEISGLVNKPQTFTIDDLINRFGQEERIYRLRCVEAWSMVIPWQGFELGDLLKLVEPTSSAKYIGFTTLYRPKEMQGQGNPFFPWPYTEGLRLDEALNQLTILATGLYGKPLPNQDGAPIRLIVPWKYGFKGIKAIVKIELLDKQPNTFWHTTSPHEYGFYANVNPNVDHPRWSQRTERRIGEFHRRETLMFNGYENEVANMYNGMDLKIYY